MSQKHLKRMCTPSWTFIFSDRPIKLILLSFSGLLSPYQFFRLLMPLYIERNVLMSPNWWWICLVRCFLVLLIVGREMLPSVDCLLPWELLRFWIMLYCVLDILNIVLWDSGSLGSIKTLWRKSTVNLVHFSLDSMSQSIFCRLWIWCQISFQSLSGVPSPGRCRRSTEQVLLELHQGASVGASSKPLLFCPGIMH